jgi:hypothetical protein
MGVLIVIGIAAIIGVGIWFSYQRKKKRRLALAAFASQYGMQYSRVDPFGLLGYDFHLFKQGDGRGCENVISGQWQGLPLREADYWYYDETTDSQGHRSKSYHYFSVVIADLSCALPYVSMTKESIFTRMADHLGFRDIDFESEAFNREFNVKASDREFAFKLVDARMMQWMVATGGRFGFEVQGPCVLVYCRRRKPADLLPLVGTAKEFSDHIPRLVLNEYGTSPQAGQGQPERSPS